MSLSRLSGDGGVVLFEVFFLSFFFFFFFFFFSFFFFLVTMCGIFLYLEVISSLCCGEMFLILPGLIPLLPAIFIPIFITTQTLSSCYILFCLPYLTVTSLSRWFVSKSFQVFLS